MRTVYSAILLLLGYAPLSPAKLIFSEDTVRAWADEYFEQELRDGTITGASFGVVQDGEIVFLKGYGYQDEARGTPVDPAQTRFRVCSTSKTFTSTAMMQLVESGAIQSLDDPVNKYLKRYRLPPPDGARVTIRQLLTHSSGMAGHFRPQGTKATTTMTMGPAEISEFFVENIERPPGQVGQYANLGVALESILIEDITGVPLGDYLDEKILQPLDMSSSMLHHSAPAPENLAAPYGRFPNGELQQIRFYPKHPLTAASGGIISTTVDMLKYAAFHANEQDRYEDVLSAAGRRELHRRHFGHHPADPGMGLHFYLNTHGGQRVVSHGCGLPGTRSMLAVLPDSNAGIMLSTIGASPEPSVSDLIGQLFGLGRLIPTEEVHFENAALDAKRERIPSFQTALIGPIELPSFSGEAPDGMVVDAAEVAGVYWAERRAIRGGAAIFAAFDTTTVRADHDGYLHIGNKRYRRVADGVYDSEDGKSRRIFRRVAENGGQYMHTSTSTSFRKVSRFSNPTTVALVFCVGLLGSLVAAGATFWKSEEKVERMTKSLAISLVLVLIMIPIFAFAGYSTITEFAMNDYANGDTLRAQLIFAMLNLHLLIGFGLVCACVYAWRTALWGASASARMKRMHLTVISAFCMLTWPGFVLFNLIGARLY
ncbi:MAG: serine hydrolase [Pseudomonadota bacterium]